MTNEEFKQSFDYCKKVNDPEQWDLLAMAYYQRGYDLNALYCFNQADACRDAELELQFQELDRITEKANKWMAEMASDGRKMILRAAKARYERGEITEADYSVLVACAESGEALQEEDE